MPKTICLDFDGVANLYTGWKGEDELFEPRPGFDSFVLALVAHGYEVVVHSTRPAEKLERWLEEKAPAVAAIVRVVDKKPPALVYLDDRGVTFTGDFDDALSAILNFKAHWEKP